MQVDWAARLDARGYHILPVRRPDTAARWDCEVQACDDGWAEGDRVVCHHDGVELQLKVGDGGAPEPDTSTVPEPVDMGAAPAAAAPRAPRRNEAKERMAAFEAKLKDMNTQMTGVLRNGQIPYRALRMLPKIQN